MRAWTKAEEDDFGKWMKKHLMKRLRWRATKAEKEVAWFNLMYSWRLPHNDGNLTLIGKEKEL